jgi:NAD(P)H-dependent flavin oxidoreductase YrpB (nitropropane dioxygenase family)
VRTPICGMLGCQVPIFAFSHCRDVVVEVTKAGGFGVLGASSFTPAQLEAELRWIDDRVQAKPYGLDIVVPGRYSQEAEQTSGRLDALIPEGHRAFMEGLLAGAEVPPLPPGEEERIHAEILEIGRNRTPNGGMRLLQVALRHPGIRLVVSALGEPRPDVIALLHQRGLLVGALCGKPDHARRNIAAGVDVLIAQGTEAGGHTGDIATMVLVPQVVEAAAGRTPVLAAGGITRGSQVAAALALGAQGVWCGTLWLGTRESELDPFEKEIFFAARSEDAVRRRCWTGKPVRMLKSELSEAWERPGAPEPLEPPLQAVLYNPAHARVVRAQRRQLYSHAAGQAVGDLREETSVREVMYRLQLEYAETLEHLQALQPAG